MHDQQPSLLEVKNLNIRSDDSTHLLKDVSFSLKKRKITCMIGQSGSGKSLTLQAILGMLPKRLSYDGELYFHDLDLLGLGPEDYQTIRGKKIFMIFQDAMNACNPSIVLINQLYWLAGQHKMVSKIEFQRDIIKILYTLGFVQPEKIVKQYPFQLSGGMLQRLMIACAIYVQPELLLADEPTTALDSKVQKEILTELSTMKNETTILLVTHDIGVVAELADEVIVISEGRIVEAGDVYKIFNAPAHEYTKKLLKDSAF